ncbi:MAG: hypothetical protein II669_03015 [Elusimicrobia bacterium]|nr:hypothetical protein [Elusimicrobiota bacterium]
MQITPFDYQLALLLGLSRNQYNGLNLQNGFFFDYIFIKSAFLRLKNSLTPEERKGFSENLSLRLI